MSIRGERTWCGKCQAPEVFPENLPILALFLDLLPAYQIAGGMGAATLQEGFDRAAVPGLMDLHGIPAPERTETWAALREMECELRRVRASKTHDT